VIKNRAKKETDEGERIFDLIEMETVKNNDETFIEIHSTVDKDTDIDLEISKNIRIEESNTGQPDELTNEINKDVNDLNDLSDTKEQVRDTCNDIKESASEIIEKEKKGEENLDESNLFHKKPDLLVNKSPLQYVKISEDVKLQETNTFNIIEDSIEVRSKMCNKLFDTSSSSKKQEQKTSDVITKYADGQIIEIVDEKPNEQDNVDDPNKFILKQYSSPSPLPNETFLLAAQDMTASLSEALNTITSTPPTPPPRVTPSVRTPLPPTPSPPIVDALSHRHSVDRQTLPSPPPEITQKSIKKVSSTGKIPKREETPPRPAPPSDIIEDLEKKIEIQYKKYPKVEHTPPRPSPPNVPLPPERSNSLGRLKSVGPSPQNTPTQKRKITIRAVKTPSPSPVPFENEKLKEPASHLINGSGFENASFSYQSTTQEETSTMQAPIDDISSINTLVCGTFQAIPVCVDESLLEDEEESENITNVENVPSTHRKTFLESMLKAENISKESFARIDQIRNHKLKELKDLDEIKKHEEIAITLELEKKQKEVEEILKKKKEAEHFKRLEFEENRIRKESEKMKKAAEQKKRREEDDKRLELEKEETLKFEERKKVLLLKERQKVNDTVEMKLRQEQITRKLEEKKNIETEEEEQQQIRKEEDKKIKIGREEMFKKFDEQRRKSKGENKIEEHKYMKSSKEQVNEIQSEQLKITENSNDFSQLIETLGSESHENVKNRTENQNTGEEVKLQIEELDDQQSITDSQVNGVVETPPSNFCSLERTTNTAQVSISTSEMTKFNNRMLQKPKVSEETEIFRDISNETSFSMSRRWRDVNTGNVKDRANTFLKPDENQHYQSPVMKRKIFNPSSWFNKSQDHRNNNSKTPTDKYDAEANKEKHHSISTAQGSLKLEKEDSIAPWRRNDKCKEKMQVEVKSPSLNLVSVSVTPSMSPKQVLTQKSKFQEEILVSSVTRNVEDMQESCLDNKETLNQHQACVDTVHDNDRNGSIQDHHDPTSKSPNKCEYLSCQLIETNIQHENNKEEDCKKVGIRLSRDRSNSPKTKSKREAEEELDMTIKQLELHVESLGDICESPSKPKLVSSAAMVSQAATSVRDAAGAVREVAQNLLKTVTPEIHPESRNMEEHPAGKVNNLQQASLSLEMKQISIKSPQDLQDVQEGKVKGSMSYQTIEENEMKRKQSQEKAIDMSKQNIKSSTEDISDSEEDSYGYEDDFSVGIDLPAATETTSGNVTPIPTTGELEELSSVEELTVMEEIILDDVRPKSQQDSRATPLKSLLKKTGFENTDANSSSSDSDSEDGKVSPKKVHFSEIDQVKLMSQESLASMATSECSEASSLPVTLCKTIMSSTPTLAVARIVTNKMASKQDEHERALGDVDTEKEETVQVRREYIK